MRKKNILNLIKFHVENNENLFRAEATEIARLFDKSGDNQLSEYIMSLLSNANTFYPQMEVRESTYFSKVEYGNEGLHLPNSILADIQGVINAINHRVGVNKFLFEGKPGSGKTESVKHIARILNRQLYMLNFNSLIDSKLGQSAKNITLAFEEINALLDPLRIIILLDEIDSIAMDRINNNDLREMGRVTSTLLRELDNLNKDIVLIATTNLFKDFDKALIRRFDSVVTFNRYKREDLLEIAEKILAAQLKIFENAGRNSTLFNKIINQYTEIPYPGDLKNIIRSSLAFSDPNNPYEYLRILFNQVTNNEDMELSELKRRKFTLREIEILTGVSKSQVSRELRGNDE